MASRLPASPRSFTHAGASGTRLWVDPDRGLVFVLLSNQWDRQLRAGARGPGRGLSRLAGLSAFGAQPLPAWLRAPSTVGTQRPADVGAGSADGPAPSWMRSGWGQAGTPFSMGTLMSEPYSVQEPS